MRTLPAALVAYGAGIVLLAEVGPPVLDAAAGVTATALAGLVDALQRAVVAAAGWARSPGSVLAVLGPLTLAAVASVVSVIVWPAVLDHVPDRLVQGDARPSEGDVIPLAAGREPHRHRRAA